MDEETRNESGEARIRREASEWVSKRDRGLTAEEQDAFFDWLAENPLHSEYYAQRQTVWSEMDVLIDWKPEHSLEPNPDLLAVSQARTPRKTIWIGATSGIAALLALGLFIGGQWERSRVSTSVYLASEDGAKSYERHVLEDGSTVELNRGAQVSARYEDGKRFIDLIAGEAHFTVEPDAARPFVVRARGTVVQAVGTAFNVTLTPSEVEVLVTEGSVLMNPSIATTVEGLIVASEPLVKEVRAGQRSVVPLGVEAEAPLVEDVSSDVMARRLAWKSELLDFSGVSLSEVLLEFNRRNHTQLVIGDSELEALKITASLNPNNLENFIQLLDLTQDIEANREDSLKVVLRKRAE